MKYQHLPEANRGTLLNGPTIKPLFIRLSGQIDLERGERSARVLEVVSECACLRILLGHSGASGGCRRMQEAAGESRRQCEGFAPLQEGGTGPSMEESEALGQHLILKRAGPDLRMAL